MAYEEITINVKTNGTDKAISSTKSLKGEIKALRKELDGLEQGTAEFDATFTKLANKMDEQKDINEALRQSIGDMEHLFQNTASTAASLAAGFSAVNAAATLMGEGSEDLQKTMTKLQAGIALVQGLKGLAGLGKEFGKLKTTVKAVGDTFLDFIKNMTSSKNATTKQTAATTAQDLAQKKLNKDTATGTIASKADAAAKTTQTAATTGLTIATKAASVALKGLKTALVATGIGALVVLLGEGLNLLSKIPSIIGNITGKTERVASAIQTARVEVTMMNREAEQYKKIKSIEYYKQEADGLDDLTIAEDKVADAKKRLEYLKEQEIAAAAKVLVIRYRDREAAGETIETYEKLIQSIDTTTFTLSENLRQGEEAASTYGTFIDLNGRFNGTVRATKEEYEALMSVWEKSADLTADAAANLEQYRIELEKLKISEEARAKGLDTSSKDYFMSDLEKLKKVYEEEKALMEQYGVDTTARTKRYYKERQDLIDKANAERLKKEEELAKKLEYYQNSSYMSLYREAEKYGLDKMSQLEYQHAETMDQLAKARQDEIDHYKNLYDEKLISEETYQKHLLDIKERYTTLAAKLEKNYTDEVKKSYEELQKAAKQNFVDNILADYDRLAAAADREYNTKIKISIDKSSNYTAKWWQKVLGMETYNKELNIMQDDIQAQIDAIQKKIKAAKDGMEKMSVDEVKATKQTPAENIDQYNNVDLSQASQEYTELYNITAEGEAQIVALVKQAEDEKRRMRQETAAAAMDAASQTFDAIANLTSSIASIYDAEATAAQNNADKHRALAEQYVGVDEAKYNAEMAMVTKYEEKQKEAEEKSKALQRTTIILQTASGMITAFATAMQLGPILGPILGAINAAAVLATGIASLKMLDNESLGESSSSTSTNTEAATSAITQQDSTAYANQLAQKDMTELQANTSDSNNTRVYVVQSDITSSQNSVRTSVKNSTF